MSKNDPLFDSIVEIFNKIRRTSNINMKMTVFRKNYGEWKENCSTAEISAILRLFLSGLEKDRKFDMGVSKLASFLAKTFSDSRKDYLDLIDKKNPSETARLLAEKLAAEYRSDDDLFGILRISEINEALDFLAAGNSMDDPKKLEKMHTLVKNCSDDELEWIFNIILKNVEPSLVTNSNKILDWVSPEAQTIWDRSHRLADVISGKIGAENAEEDFLDDTVSVEQEDEHLFKIFTPMLLTKQKRQDWYGHIQKYAGENFFLQTKFDGENVLLHKKNGEYRWFSRNNNDFSMEYGNNSKSAGKLASRIHTFFKSDVESAIFNCELMLWDKKTRKLCRHNDASATSDYNVLSFRHIKPSDNQQLVAVIFDILYLNGKPLFGAPLHERLELLKLVLRKQAEDTIFVAENERGNSKEDIQRFFEKAMASNEEGIVVKRADSQYKIGERDARNGWFKIKPSASKDCDLDLALIAIHPGGGRYGKPLFRFAAKETNSNNFRICLSSSYGLANDIRDAVRQSSGTLLEHAPSELRTRFGKVPKDIPPGEGGYVDSERWQVIKITSNGVRNGKLVDPVMSEWRIDKPVEQCDTIEDFADYSSKVLECKLADEVVKEEDDGVFKKPRTYTRKAIEKEACSPIKIKRERLESKLTGIEVAVLQGTSEKLRRKCEEILLHFGAKVVKNETDGTKLVVATAPKRDYFKTMQSIKKNRCTVLKAQWLERCDGADEVLEWDDGEEVFHEVPGAFKV